MMSKQLEQRNSFESRTTPRRKRGRMPALGTLAFPAFLLLAGCASTQRVATLLPNDSSTSTDALAKRAKAYWSARGSESWDDLFQYQPPKLQAETTVDQFREWSANEDPFIIKKWSIKDHRREGTFGWVRVDYTAGLRRFPTLPPKQKTHWQRWVVLEGNWYPVPQTELDQFPETPAIRDGEAEKVLRTRFESTWKSRKNADWSAMYEKSDPRDRDSVSLDQFAESEGRFLYLDIEIHWVEVIGDYGRILATYEHKPSDPNMTKMPSQRKATIEHWVQVENQWYRDLIRRKG